MTKKQWFRNSVPSPSQRFHCSSHRCRTFTYIISQIPLISRYCTVYYDQYITPRLKLKITAKVGIKHQLLLVINQSMIILQIYNHRENQLLYSLQDEDILKENLPVTQIRFPAFPLSGAIEENRLLASCKSLLSAKLQSNWSFVYWWRFPGLNPTKLFSPSWGGE